MSTLYSQRAPRTAKFEIQIPKPSGALMSGAILTYIASILLLIAFASPYWLVSWDMTFSPFKKMGLWEICFDNYRHPHYQFDKLFHGCHYVFSDEYRIIREWLLPGWLMAVQAFVTLAFMASLATQIMLAMLVTRFPLQFVLNSEWILSVVCALGNAASAFFMFLAVAVFGGECFRRDWVQYPTYNYLSWGYAFAVVSMFIFAFAAFSLWGESKEAKQRVIEGDGHAVLQMHPTNGHGHEPEADPQGGMPNPGSDIHHFV